MPGETKRKLNVVGWTLNPKASSSAFYRMAQPLQALKARGHRTFWCDSISRIPEEFSGSAIIGQYIAGDARSEAWKAIAERGDNALIYEIDDDILHIDPHTHGPGHSFFGRSDIQDDIIANIRVSNLVITSTEPLRDLYSRWNPNTITIPNYIAASARNRRRQHHEMSVGWAGSYTHARDLKDEGTGVRTFFQAHPNVELTMLTDEAFAQTFAHHLGARKVKTRDWTHSIAEHYNNLDFDIGLCPLTRTRFNAGKSAIKALEYSARGIIPIASPTPAYRQFIDHAVNGIICPRPGNWDHALTTLRNEPQMRQALATAAYEHTADWTIEANAYRYEEAIASCL